jgi:phospholipid/cholesterol/gamma-HCH transport system permease protein
LNIVRIFGSGILKFIAGVGSFSILIGRIVKSLPYFLKKPRLTSEQMLIMGVASLPLVIFTSVFTGAVSAVQAAYQFKNIIPLTYLGGAVGKAVVIELGPVLTALVIAGRVGASIAAEIGTMKVTEQIDALETMALDPVKFLAVPRFVSGIIMLPILTIFADFIAIMGGLFVAVFFLDLNSYTFLNSLKRFFELFDLFGGLLKAGIFGAIIAVVGCYHGFRTSGGAEGVGLSTTRAVVYSSVLILIADYVVAHILFA